LIGPKEDRVTIRKQLQNQKGMALVVILAVLVLMSLLGTTLLFNSDTGRKISMSYRGSADALQNAEAGIADAARKLFNKDIVGPVVPCGDTSSTALNWKYDGYTANVANEYTASYVFREDNGGVKRLACDEAGNPLYQINSSGYVTTTFSDGKLNKNYVVASSGYAGVEKKLLAMVQVINTPGTPGTQPVTTTTTVLDKAFGMGILADGNLTVNGTSTINGDAHSNGNIKLNGDGTITGTVSAQGSITTGSWNTEEPAPNGAAIPVPQVTTQKLDELRTIANTAGKGIYSNGDFNFNGSGDLGNQVIFVDGNLTLNGDIINGTIVATGNVTINGSSQINGNGVIGTAIVAQGNITMNGSSDSYGAFWSNGSFVQNGSGRLLGSIVSLGTFTQNGGFNFTANGNIQNNNLPTVTTTVTIPGTPGTPAISTYKVLSRKEV
jgi:Tfp pilus assembly protein PilX/cytoskeletal protein CcmA (bactofilin family)